MMGNLKWLCLIIFHSVAGTPPQECSCKLHDKELTADCSALGLTSISEIFNCVPNTVRKLILSYNKINSIPPEMLTLLEDLRELNLEHNIIEHLQNDSFSGLSKLEYLSLSYNLLRHNDSYADDVFKPLRNLRRLYLQGNCNVHTSVCLYPDKALSAATTLEYLSIDGIPNHEFGKGFSKLKNLNSLYLSDDNGYCHIPVLTENTFDVFKHTPISNLQLESCEITKLAPNVFRSLHNLTYLIITRNRKLCADSIENATVGLNETNIQTMRFNYWCRHPPFYPILAENNFRGLTNTSLRVLDLGWNYIIHVDPSVIENLPTSLEYFSLKQNSIGNAQFLLKLSRLYNLNTLDGSFQNYFQAEIKTLERARGETAVGGLYRKIIKLQSAIKSPHKTYTDNRLQLPRNLQTLYMNNIHLEYPVPSVTFAPNKLRYLNASSCMLLAFFGPWYGLKDLQILDISNNKFSFFHQKSLIDMGNLTSLFLQHTEIGKSLYRDVNGVTFSSLRKLRVLDLRSSIIKDLPYSIFKNQIDLRYLSLGDNSVKNVSFLLKSMTKLRHLDLSDNEIGFISEQNMAFLDQIATNRKIDLDLSGNNLNCMCNNQVFVNWLATTRVNIIQKDNLSCLYINETLVSLSRLEFIREQLKYECTSWIVMTSCVIGFIGLLLVLSLVALLYYKRWQLRYLWYIGRVKIDPYHHPHDQEHIILKIDAYISYEQHYDFTDDVSLHQVITDKLYPFFEERGYTLNIREEFDGNEKLYHVIPQAVRKSRKVVVFLTPSYCEDYWNTFEFNIAAYEGIYTKRNIIIPVLLGDVSEKHLMPEIRSFIRSKIKSNEVLRFPSSENDIAAFNEQLENMIRNRL
ncbi:toll-like receptor 4 [Mercenaria mercenaria]|uniref:toll-like receptor 4 n=1 Tax=Mercenaria mercenaria TaxID=6596 RepID=UPI00234EF7F0|nr:toll-like receptor 4 [Mercenaria mercenaria]XP_045200577.2 toll-like receptor 4 [Mercenaria mercenaria]XP_053404041.1 toll-like receptor 4 [Mercenaria mercenaria]